ncbi:MAG: GAF domain-containing protein, partial [Anaerolineae bacterium]|nr:GAF domain-containing protein [Anaerolineae bacterium]
TAIVVGVLATVILAVILLFPAIYAALPVVVMIGDWVMTVAFIYASRGNPLLIVAIGGLILVASVIRLGALWGAIQAIGVLIAIGVGLGASFGFANLNTVINQNAQPLILVAVIGVVSWIWGFVVQRQIQSQVEQLSDVQYSKSAQLDDLRERTRAIYEMGATLSSTLSYQKILDAAMSAGSLGLRDLDRRGKERLACAVLLFRSKDNALHVATGRGLARTDEERVTPGESGIIAETLKTCMPVFGTNAKKDPELQYFVAFQSCRSVLCIPLRAGFDNYGVLLFGSDRTDAFTDEHTELLTSVGTQATVALQNAVLYENLLNERNRIVEVEEEARKKLARDLHDGPTQNVAAIAMRMSIIYRMMERTPDEVPAELKKIEEIARKTTKEIRHMLFTLRPLVLENQGLTAALEQLAEKMKETHDQAVAVRVSKEAERALDNQQQGPVFYIIEEAVGNARKHAQAKLITVTVNRQEDVVVVQIADNGVGFDTKAVEANYDSRGSLGMVNLKERTELLGGTLRIESKLGRGTTITVLVPIKDSPTQGSRDRQMRNLASTGSTTKLAAAAVERIRAAQLHDD